MPDSARITGWSFFTTPHFDRTTNGTGHLAQKTLAELRALDAGASFSNKFSGEKIPLLEEVFDAVGKKTFIMLNLKITLHRAISLLRIFAPCGGART